MTTARRFQLHRVVDVTGVSGTGIVAEGVAFSDGSVALRWLSEWPTSVVFHDRGVESIEHVHGHGGATRIVWIDMLSGPPEPAVSWPDIWAQLTGYVQAATENPKADDAQEILHVMSDLKRQRLAPIGEWMHTITGAGSLPVAEAKEV